MGRGQRARLGAPSTRGGSRRSGRAGARGDGHGAKHVQVSRGFAETGFENTTRSPSSTSSVSFTRLERRKSTVQPASRGLTFSPPSGEAATRPFVPLTGKPVLGPGVGPVGQEAACLKGVSSCPRRLVKERRTGLQYCRRRRSAASPRACPGARGPDPASSCRASRPQGVAAHAEVLVVPVAAKKSARGRHVVRLRRPEAFFS